MKKLLLTFLIAFITALGLNAEDYYTIQFNSSYGDPSVTTYTDSWTATRDGKKWNLVNFNNNNYQNNWAYIKCGRKKSASVATFSSDAALPEKISTVTVTIDAIATNNVNSISLTVADDAQFETNAATYTAATLAKGDLPFTIDKPAANKFYKLTFDCKKSSNGVIQISKVVFSGNDDLPTSCEAPNFNFEENAEVTTGDVIKATCTTDNSTVYLKVGNADFEQTDSYPITKELATGPLSFEAYATVQGANGIIESDHKILNVNVVKKLGDIMYNGEAVPATISLKGGETLTFTSANAVSMTLVVNSDEANKKTTLDTGEISWTAPAATEAADQTYALSITSKLDDAVKTANTTVTVAKKPTVETFELLTDLSDVNEENTYILFGTAEKNPDGNQHLMNTTVDKFFGTLDINDSYITISKDKSIIEIPPTTTGVAYITLEKTTTEGSYKLKVGEQYIKFVGEKNVALTETKAAGNDFTISFNTTKNNSIQIKSQINSSDYILAYNASNPRFTSYGVSTNLGRQHLYVKRAAPSVKVPGDVTSEPAAVEGVITINKNDEITFSSKDAAKLQVSTQLEPVVGSSYKYTPTEEGEVTITPIDSEGKVYTEKAATFTIKFFVAPEAPTFTPNGSDVNLFSTVKIACATEGATLTYKIGDGEATAYPADGIKMTKAGKVTITAIATKNGLSTETIKTFNVTDNREKVYVKFYANKYEFTVGEEFESPVAKACTYNNGDFVEIPDFTETINYESDNTSVAEVNATTGALTLKAAGTCNITASLKSETYKSDPDHYTLTVNKGLVDGLIEYPVSEFVYTIGSGEQLPELVKEPADVDVEYSISHNVAVYNPATIDEQGNITVNTPGIVTVTATVKADRSKTASYVLEIQSLREAEIAGTGSATPTGNVYTKVVDDKDYDLYENGHLYAILSYHDGKVYAMTPEAAGANEGLKAVVIKEGVRGFEDTYTIDNSKVANMLLDLENTLCFTYNDNGTLKYLVSPSDRHMQLTAKTPTEPQSFAYNSTKEYPYDPVYGKKEASLLIDVTNDLAIFCNPSKLYFNTFEASNRNFGTDLFNCFLYKVGAQITSASTVKAPVVHITGGNVYYSPDGEWYWGTEDENNKLSFANETEGAKIYYTMTSATPSSANVRAMANSATVTEYSTPFKKRDLDGKKITFWAEKDGQKSAVETLNFNIKTGIENIDVENAEAIEEDGDARYFNLQGLEVKNPGEGIYIRVANGKATKILKK